MGGQYQNETLRNKYRNCVDSAQYRDYWKALVNVVALNLQVHKPWNCLVHSPYNSQMIKWLYRICKCLIKWNNKCGDFDEMYTVWSIKTAPDSCSRLRQLGQARAGRWTLWKLRSGKIKFNHKLLLALWYRPVNIKSPFRNKLQGQISIQKPGNPKVIHHSCWKAKEAFLTTDYIMCDIRRNMRCG